MRISRLTLGMVASAGLAVLAFAGCGSSNDSSKGSSKGDAGYDGGTGGGSGADGGGCQTDADCGGGGICHPYQKVCTSPGSACSAQSECGVGTYCDSTVGKCLSGGTGNPCDSDANCIGAVCNNKVCGCAGIEQQQESYGALDIYFIFDRTASMGEDCDYQAGTPPPVSSKACFATYALSDYLTNVQPSAPTRLAFQFMSLPGGGCDGTPYSTALADFTTLPLAASDPIVQAISAENFAGGYGTEIEGALRGIANYTSTHRTPGHEIIGVLMTDGDPNGCDEDIGNLSQIISTHLAQTGIRTFIIGMEGATDANLEQYAVAGGAAAHSDWCGSVNGSCHFWNVGDGSGDAIASALRAILAQATPLPCEYPVENLTPPTGQTLDYNKVNVRLAEGTGPTIIGQVPDLGSCPADQPAWYYDNPGAPTQIELCKNACDLVTNAQNGSSITVVVGCDETVMVQ